MKRIFLTYTKKNTNTGEVYSGRASGTNTARNILLKRDSSHHKNKDNFGNAKIDKVATDGNAIRGREQLLIEKYGGAKSNGGSSGNQNNGISYRNKQKKIYIQAAIKLFGTIVLVILVYIFASL
ncbi:MAG: hypothetical protein AAF518_19950 [Spirochaetota bacterium]